MTDNEIIKALGHCASGCSSEACTDCPFDEKSLCIEKENALAIYALDLVNRQKAEIEEKNELIERLQNANVRALRGTTEIVKANAKAEAIKEFAERLKKECITKYDWNDCVDVEDIDNLVKEMVGDE